MKPQNRLVRPAHAPVPRSFSPGHLEGLAKDHGKGAEQNLHVAPARNGPRVFDVEVNHLLECGRILAADLPKPGQTGHGVETLAVPRTKPLILVANARAGANQA